MGRTNGSPWALVLLMTPVGCAATTATPDSTATPTSPPPVVEPTYEALDHALAKRAAGRTHAPDLSSAEAFVAWKEGARRRLLEVLHLPPTRKAAPAAVEETNAEAHEGYARSELRYDVAPGLRVVSDLYLPATGAKPFVGLVLLPGHDDTGRRSAATTGAAAALARAGYAVTVPGLRSFDGSRQAHEAYVRMQLLDGVPAIGRFVADAVTAVVLLAARPEVDPHRIGIAGLDVGGLVALLVAALDDRLRAAVIDTQLASFSGAFVKTAQSACLYVPGLGEAMDLSAIGMLAAPAPTLYVGSHEDPTRPINEATAAYFEIRKAYELIGSPQAVLLHRHRGEPKWQPRAALDWLEQHL